MQVIKTRKWNNNSTTLHCSPLSLLPFSRLPPPSTRSHRCPSSLSSRFRPLEMWAVVVLAGKLHLNKTTNSIYFNAGLEICRKMTFQFFGRIALKNCLKNCLCVTGSRRSPNNSYDCVIIIVSLAVGKCPGNFRKVSGKMCGKSPGNFPPGTSNRLS